MFFKRSNLVKEEALAHLKYERALYTCIHYGKPRVRSSGKRPSQHYFASDCRAEFNLSIDRDADEGIRLHITDVVLDHNHELSEHQFSYYPKNRRLSPKEKEEAKELLKLRVKPSDLKATVCSATHKRVQTKDILNIAQGLYEFYLNFKLVAILTLI